MRRKAAALGVMLTLAALVGIVIGVGPAGERPAPERTEAQKGLGVEEAGSSGTTGPLSPIQKRAIEEGPLVPNRIEYERAKAEANARAERHASGEGSSSPETWAPASSP